MSSSPSMNNIRFEEQEFYTWLNTVVDCEGPVGLTAKFYVKKDKVPQFCQVMKNNVDYSVGEKGVILYKLQADYKDSNIFWLIEEWESVSDLKAHCLSETYKKNADLLTSLLQEPVCQIGLYKAMS